MPSPDPTPGWGSDAPSCGFGYGTVCIPYPIPTLPFLPVTSFFLSPRIPTSLAVVGDCYYSQGIDIAPGIYTRAITYQVLDQYGQPMKGIITLSGVVINEAVYTISGPSITGRGVWTLGSGLHSDGTFWDYLHGTPLSGTSFAAQLFLGNGLPLYVLGFGGSGAILLNTYTANKVTDNGATYSSGLVTINGTISARPCGQNGDPLENEL